MVVSSVEIKKNIIRSVLDFSSSSDSGIPEFEISNIRHKINELTSMLEQPQAMLSRSDISKPRADVSEYPKLKRIIDLTFLYGSDINAVAIDINERLPNTNRLLLAGVDYLIDNLKNSDFRGRNDIQGSPEEQITEQTEVLTPVVDNSPPVNNQQVQKKSGLGLIPVLLFLLILFGGGFAIFKAVFDRDEKRVATLIQEYRSDRDLSSVSRKRVSDEVKIYGSSSLLSVVDMFKGVFESRYPSLSLKISQGDSEEAITKLINGEITLAAVSKMPTVQNRRKAQKQGRLITDHKVAMDAVAVFVHKSNPIDSLSVEDLKDIFSSDSLNWKKYGWGDSDIDRFSKSPGSGTYGFFKERVLVTDDFSENIIRLYDSKQIVNMVENNPNAIGFASASDLIGKDVKVIRISTIFDDKGVSPLSKDGVVDRNSILRGEYPLTRYLYLLSAGEISDEMAKLIDFFRDEENREYISKAGLISIY